MMSEKGDQDQQLSAEKQNSNDQPSTSSNSTEHLATQIQNSEPSTSTAEADYDVLYELPSTSSASTIPKKPRGRMPAFAFYVRECHSEFKCLNRLPQITQRRGILFKTNVKCNRRSHPRAVMPVQEFSKLCAASWRQLSPSDKEEFHRAARRDAERYAKEMTEYKRIMPQKPKRPLNGFLRFSQEHRSQVKEFLTIQLNRPPTVVEIVKEIGRMWRSVDRETQLRYKEESKTTLQNYAASMETFRRQRAQLERQLKATLGDRRGSSRTKSRQRYSRRALRH